MEVYKVSVVFCLILFFCCGINYTHAVWVRTVNCELRRYLHCTSTSSDGCPLQVFFPSGDAQAFCEHVFRTFDQDKSGFIDFKVSFPRFDVAIFCKEENVGGRGGLRTNINHQNCHFFPQSVCTDAQVKSEK